uniref:Uncharacterized protein n=1 Tax=Micrurus spixii TaxID=129469 RepID=A0A2D4NJ82_9SAUR
MVRAPVHSRSFSHEKLGKIQDRGHHLLYFLQSFNNIRNYLCSYVILPLEEPQRLVIPKRRSSSSCLDTENNKRLKNWCTKNCGPFMKSAFMQALLELFLGDFSLGSRLPHT